MQINFEVCKKTVLVLFFVLIGLFFICHYGINTPQYEDFTMVDLVSRSILPTLDDFLIFDGCNSIHCTFVPRIVYYITAKLSNMNVVAVMFVSLAFMMVLYFALCCYYLVICGLGKASYWSLACFGLLFFNPIQWENMLWAFQITFYMAYVFSAFSFIFLILLVNNRENSNRYLCLCLACAIVASFSSFQGLMTWPVLWGIYILYGRNEAHSNAIHDIAIVICSVAVCAVYITHFYLLTPADTDSSISFKLEPFTAIEYFFTVCGNPVTIGLVAIPQGIIVCALWVYCIVHFMKYGERKSLLPVTLIIYALLVAICITLGRNGEGVRQAHASRYTTFILAGYIGALFYLTKNFSTIPAVRKGVALLTLFLCLVTPLYIFTGMARYSERLSYQREILLTYKTQPDEHLAMLWLTNLPLIKESAEILEQRRLSAFSDSNRYLRSTGGDETRLGTLALRRETIKLPDYDDELMVTATLLRTLPGRIATALSISSEVLITVTFQDGSTLDSRMIPKVKEATKMFAAMREDQAVFTFAIPEFQGDYGKKAVSVTLPYKGDTWAFQDSFHINFSVK